MNTLPNEPTFPFLLYSVLQQHYSFHLSKTHEHPHKIPKQNQREEIGDRQKENELFIMNENEMQYGNLIKNGFTRRAFGNEN